MAMPNLHELANAPGFGKASEACRSAGYWDPARGNEPVWRVTVSGLVLETAELKIAAATPEAAEAIAEAIAIDDWKLDWTYGEDIDVSFATAVEWHDG